MANAVFENQPTVDDIYREVNRIKSIVTDAVDDGVQSAIRAVKQGRDAAEDVVHDTRYRIKRNPLQAAGIFLAAGVVIGSLVTLFTVRRS
ncbi:MAG: hypothetical protein ABSD61_02760 [Terracidiphilus sp.]|jgi:ElaB/YqjD/DUF883 family membrane-anchored ribosome-binding protein